ncbi:h domain protein [Nocardia goodfellowii]|uniref:Mce-associated membrane protein n=1 Tax=Nocardia goodfellowii TaxID=882446 RepID=A0ABS4Q7W1_9NOCA|nr:h domain protein [Nocardia goodfellowii]MBP2187678.1 Mce-associated membrane protein [Nocardia goodfellowii]
MRKLGTRGLIAAAVAGVLVAASLVVMGINGYRYWDDQRAEQSRTEVVDVASRSVSAMFTYDFNTVDQELPKAAEALSPKFREDYLKLISQAIAPGAKDKQLTVRATAQAGGVVSADPEHAVVLLFLNQITTSKDSPQGTTTGSRVRVTLDKAGERWLVDAVTPI